MKLTSKQLKEIIKEELNNTVNEAGFFGFGNTYGWQYDKRFIIQIAKLFAEEFGTGWFQDEKSKDPNMPPSRHNLDQVVLDDLNEEIIEMISDVYDHFAEKIFDQ